MVGDRRGEPERKNAIFFSFFFFFVCGGDKMRRGVGKLSNGREMIKRRRAYSALKVGRQEISSAFCATFQCVVLFPALLAALSF